MYKIVNRKQLSNDTFLMDITCPRIAESALPGQFVIIKMKLESERIPLTISDNNPENGTVSIVFKAVGKSTNQMALYRVG
ncbi:MAG: NAD-binding oxidoreductase, partial [Bacteroidales bacterium]|nr:NAD-binding oxidoreductase [Bacteroidales bacterium]